MSDFVVESTIVFDAVDSRQFNIGRDDKFMRPEDNRIFKITGDSPIFVVGHDASELMRPEDERLFKVLSDSPVFMVERNVAW